MAKLQDTSCAEESLFEEIAAVYGAIESALSKGAQSADKDAGRSCATMLRHISGSRPNSQSEELMAALYEHERPAFIKDVQNL